MSSPSDHLAHHWQFDAIVVVQMETRRMYHLACGVF